MSKYDIFVVDPPWPQKKGGRRNCRPNQGRRLDYKTMGVDDIFDLMDADIFPLAKDSHCVFVWTIERYLTECDAEMSRRGYKRHVRMVWDKGNGVAPAFTVRYCHEYLVWYYKSPMPKIAADKRGKFKSVFLETLYGFPLKIRPALMRLGTFLQ